MTVRKVTLAGDVDEEILNLATSVYEDSFKGEEVDWPDFLEKMDGSTLVNGDTLEIDASLVSPAVIKIKTHVSQLAK